jgi:hypothetical protein
MNDKTITLLKALERDFPGQKHFTMKSIEAAAEKLGFNRNAYKPFTNGTNRVKFGVYDLTSYLANPTATPAPAPVAPPPSAPQMTASVTSVVNNDSYVPAKDPTYIKWGLYEDVASIIRSRAFYPIYIAGLSGNGKSMMIEQACANLGREYIRVQISPETDEDDLIGGFRLLNGETVFAKGPVLKAMERGSILLIDELDRGTNKIMCLQGVLEGKPIMVKKTGEVIYPAPGFNVIATANTKGKGSDDGRFVAAQIIDEAFLERFAATVEQPYAPRITELKIVQKHMEKFGKVDLEFADRLVTWSEVIRKTFEEDAVDELISTRRLCHIAQTFSIFNDRLKAIKMCIARFDGDTKTAFLDLYTKVDATVSLTEAQPNVIDKAVSNASKDKGSDPIPF